MGLSKLMECKLGEAEKCITGIEFEDSPCIMEELEKVHRLVKFGYFVRVKDLNLDIFEGMFESWDEDEEDYITNCSVTIICKLDESHEHVNSPSRLYWEEDGIVLTLYNYLKDQDYEKLSALDCEIWGTKLD